MPTNKPRYTITLSEEMLKRIADYRFENRFSSMTKATLELIHIGLTVAEKKRDTEIQQDTPSIWCRYAIAVVQAPVFQRSACGSTAGS